MTTQSSLRPSMWQRSTTRRFLKWLFTLRTAGWALLGLVALVTLIAFFLAEENWRGKHAWERYKQTLEAQGEQLTLLAFVPPPVPDEQNFAMTPLLKPLFPRGNDYAEKLAKRLELSAAKGDETKPAFGSWKSGFWSPARPTNLKEWQEYLGTTNLLQFLKRFDPELDEITAASRRPYARFPLQYERGIAMMQPHLDILRRATTLYTLRASVELAEGQTDRAAADVATIFRLADSLAQEPVLVSQLTRAAISAYGLQVAWEGLSRHQWSNSQLAMFQDELRRMDFLSGGLRALRGERAIHRDTFEWIIASPERGWFRAIPRSLVEMLHYFSGADNQYRAWEVVTVLPRGWLYQNMLALVRFFQEQWLPTINLAERRVYPRKAEASEEHLLHMRRTPYNLLVGIFVPSCPRYCMRVAQAQVEVDEAMIACALERYRLAHGEFPERLDALSTQFIRNLPHDVINGEPLHYRRTADGQFLLYSVGWNETDDGGEVALTDSKPPGQDFERGDWVWSYPPHK